MGREEQGCIRCRMIIRPGEHYSGLCQSCYNDIQVMSEEELKRDQERWQVGNNEI